MSSALDLSFDKQEFLKDAITIYALKTGRGVSSFDTVDTFNDLLDILGYGDLDWYHTRIGADKVGFCMTDVDRSPVVFIYSRGILDADAVKGVQDVLFIPEGALVFVASGYSVNKYSADEHGLVHGGTVSFDYFFGVCNVYRGQEVGFMSDGDMNLSNVHMDAYTSLHALHVDNLFDSPFLERNDIINLYSEIEDNIFEDYWSSSNYVKTMLHNILYGRGYDAWTTKVGVDEYTEQIRGHLIADTIRQVSGLLPYGFDDAVERGVAKISDKTLVDMIEHQWSLYVDKGESRLLTVL